MKRHLQGLYHKTFEVVSRMAPEPRTTVRRGVLTPGEVNALKSLQQNLQPHVPKIQSQIGVMQEKVYQGIMNRRARNDN